MSMTAEQFPQITTKRLVLRELRQTDHLALYRIFKDPDVTRFYNIQAFDSLEDSLALLERRMSRYRQGRGIHWAITLNGQEDVLIGCCGFNAWFPRRRMGEIGYELERPYWNQGIMTEALRQIVSYGFNIKRMNSIEAWVMPGNIASVRVLTKLDFQSKGIKENKGYWNGRFHDLEQFTYNRTQFDHSSKSSTSKSGGTPQIYNCTNNN